MEGVSLVKRHTRPNPPKQIKGGIAERESSDRDFERNDDDLGRRGHAGRAIARRAPARSSRQVRVAKKGGEILDKKA